MSTHAVVDVRNCWPMGLGKYLMDKLEVSMLDAGVLQVDTVEGKSGNYVYINGRSVGLSNKLNDFAELASSMSLTNQSWQSLPRRLLLHSTKATRKNQFL